MHHSGRIHMRALHAECVRVNDQLRPATPAGRADVQQGQAAGGSQQDVIVRLQLQPVERGDGFLPQELRGQCTQTVLAGRIERSDPGAASADRQS
ncbi:UNVERIFIED_ORG: hypothetical protein GGR78_003942 [Xanthomonas campestris]